MPVPRAAALELASRGQRFIVKAGEDTLRFDRISRGDLETCFVHEDGFLRVPVLILGDLIIRGYTDEIYREALDAWREGGGAGMIIKETARSTYLDVSRIDWVPTKYPGVETKTLYRDAASGRLTTLTRMAPGARLPEHRHTGVEQSFVLEGTLADDDGACTAGNFVHRRPGSVHAAWTPDGCVVLGIFDAPNEFLA